MNTAEGAPGRWQELGRAVRDRRDELHLTQGQLAKRAGLSEQTVSRIERGRPSTRHTSSWSKLEVALELPRGYVEEFLDGKRPDLKVPEVRYERESRTVTTDFVRDLVQNITLAVAPDAPLHRVVEGQRRAEEALRAIGLLPPVTNQDSDQEETNPESDTPNP